MRAPLNFAATRLEYRASSDILANARGRTLANLRFRAVLQCAMVIGAYMTCMINTARATTGASVPWTTYEAEGMTVSGGFILGPGYTPNTVQSESSGRKCVRLNNAGHYIQFVAQSNANAIVVRYSIADTGDGTGTNSTLSLYTNGVFACKLPVTSKYSWLYGGYPFSNTPGSSPRNFFDEVRTNNLAINAGDVVRLQKDATDTASYYDIDLVDLESVLPALSQPGGSVSIKSAPYNAAGNGVNDDTAALQNCINANSSVWVPAGNYKITSTITIPANRTIKGAGMWYSTLVGDAAVYTNANSRVRLNGNGSNIQLSDLAIVGKLNYRNDSESNDGLGGSFGTGSSISRLWVEHTKTGAWIVNSLGLTVDSCRFRNTIADGINLVVGMRSGTVTNCTARGTGDDCFAVWPATYLSPVYAPGLNVITHCTGQVPFLANGGAIYGGDSNRIEDCLFQDMTYGCGILFSTTFTVSATFSGTTMAQRCDLNRCGGYDPGLTWRAALQFFLQNTGITGVNLNNLNITNSVSDGMSVVYGAGAGLSNAIASNVSIPNYGLGVSGRHGLWARSDAVGSLTVSNSTVVEYQDDSPTFNFNFVTSTVPVTVQSSPAGLSFTVDGVSYTNSHLLNWLSGSAHTIATTSPQSGGTGVQYLWNSWSDGGALSHSIAPISNTTYIAIFATQYFLTMNAGAGGSVSPASGWTNSGAVVSLSETASNGNSFGTWTGSGSGSYSGSNGLASVTMNGPITETATFVPDVSVTVEPNPSGRLFAVDSVNYTNAHVFSWVPGAGHTISAATPQSGSAGIQYVWNAWSDGGGISHVIAPTSNTNYTATFTTQYFLTMNAGSGGTVSPGSGWTNSGASISISATASNAYSFGSWTGSGSGSYSGSSGSASVTMNGPITETATFVPDVSITVQPSPTGCLFTVDSASYTNVQLFSWVPGSSHAIAATSPQAAGTGTQYVWSSWSDGGAMSHSIAPASNATYTASFTTQYFLTMNASAGGGVSPGSGWNDSGASVSVSATASNGYSFGAWTGSGTGSYSGTNNPGSILMNGPITETGGFSAITNGSPPAQSITSITVAGDGSVTLTYAATPGFSYHLESTSNLNPAFWTSVPGSITNATGASVTFTDPTPSSTAPIYYRTVSP